jgi:hypothetical protein
MTPSQIKIICKDNKLNKNGLKINNFSLLKIPHKKLILFTCIVFASLSFVPNVDAFTIGKVNVTASTGSPEIHYRDILDTDTGDSPNVTFVLDAINYVSTVGKCGDIIDI